MTSWPARRFGHGSGLHTTEPPYISLDDDTILEAGMILHIEPGCIEEDGIYVLEEQVVVTESGSKVLSHAPWELQAKKNCTRSGNVIITLRATIIAEKG